jgi:transcriptional regulator with XRE-family HTH domain
MNSIGKIIKKLRKDNDLTLEQLSNNLNSIYGCNLNKGMISKWELDKSEPRFEYAKYIADYFKVSVDYLLGRGSICDLGNAIKEERENQGLSIKELANSLGIKEQELLDYEYEELPVDSNIAERIAAIFDMSLFEFLDKYDLYDEYIPAHFDGDVNRYENFKKALANDRLNDSLSNDENQLLSKFNKLNDLGKKEAIKRVDELTEIGKYVYEKEYLKPLAAHDKDGDFSEEDKQHDIDIMKNDELWD